MLGFRRRWRRGLLGLYRAALLHTSISSDSLSSFPLPAFLSPARSILFPSFPSDIRGLPPLPPLFQPSLSLPPSPSPPPPTALPPLPPPPLPRATSRPSFATHLPKPPFLSLLSPSSFSQPRHPSALFLAASVSRRLTSTPSFSRPLPRNAPADKQTADTSQFYAIVSFFICLPVSMLIQILLHTRGGEDPLARKYPLVR